MSNPVDVAKTRLMNQKAEEGKPLLLDGNSYWFLEGNMGMTPYIIPV